MNTCQSSRNILKASLVFLAISFLSVACQREPPPRVLEVAYVKGRDVPVRDQLGPASSQIAKLSDGTKVEILGKRPRWAQIRLDKGRTGWILARSLAAEDLFLKFKALSDDAMKLPLQGKAKMRWEANLHSEPGRTTPTFYRLAEGEAVDVVAHKVVGFTEPVRRTTSQEDASDDDDSSDDDRPEVEVESNEDWMLVRASGGRAGWVREPYADMDLPIEVAKYREGQRIRSWFVLYDDQSDGESHPWYLWATMRPKGALPFDYEEFRVFIWNSAKSRYETSYRERNLIGFYPVEVKPGGRADGATGPSFSITVEDSSGNRSKKSYTMNGHLVHSAS